MSEKIPKIPGLPEGKQLSETEINFMKLIEEKNLVRVHKLKQTKRNNFITAGLLGGAVFGIYLYSMLAVKQEKFLDDFEEPKKINVETS